MWGRKTGPFFIIIFKREQNEDLIKQIKKFRHDTSYMMCQKFSVINCAVVKLKEKFDLQVKKGYHKGSGDFSKRNNLA